MEVVPDESTQGSADYAMECDVTFITQPTRPTVQRNTAQYPNRSEKTIYEKRLAFDRLESLLQAILIPRPG
jgi:hypothetical protein